MSLIAAVIATALCAFVYVRMYKRELPEPIGKKKAVIPLAFGFAAIVLSILLLVASGVLARALTGGEALFAADGSPAGLVFRSLLHSFLLAGFTEELAKFLLFLLVLKIVKPANVYEYGLLCAGVGLGFTAGEEFLYAGNGLVVMVIRICFFAMHLLFGLLMGTHLGLARFCRQEKRGGAGKHVFLALFLPVLWHTVFDAATTANAALDATEESVQIGGAIVALAVMLGSVVLQYVLLLRFKRQTEAYCAMTFRSEELPAEPVTEM